MVGEKFDSVEKLVVKNVQEFNDFEGSPTAPGPTIIGSGALFVSGGALLYKGYSGTLTTVGVS